MGKLSFLLKFLLFKISDFFKNREINKIRQQTRQEIEAAALADQKKRKTAGEIAAEALQKAQEKREKKYHEASEQELLDNVQSTFNNRNKWM